MGLKDSRFRPVDFVLLPFFFWMKRDEGSFSGFRSPMVGEGVVVKIYRFFWGGGGGAGGLETCEVSMIGAAGFKVSGSTGFIVRATTKTTANEV